MIALSLQGVEVRSFSGKSKSDCPDTNSEFRIPNSELPYPTALQLKKAMSEIMPTFHEPPLILVADDDKTTRIGVRQAMEQDGYQVIEAVDGKMCLAVFERSRPDIVLLDVIMPLLDGFTCCEQIRVLSGIRQTPVIMITGLEDHESVDYAFSVGAVDYITKPIHWGVLRQRVRQLLQQARLYQQLEATNHELQRLAASDGLTHVANRRRFDEYLHQEWQHLLREQLPLSLILCDIDCFKLYNDTYGHQAGDVCLQQVAQVIQVAVKRSIDLPARYGGEEFAVILPNTDSEGAIQVVQAILAGVREAEIVHATSRVCSTVTVSLGISSTVPSLTTSPEQLIRAADRALYQAKAEGRDRYCFLSE
jgi:diguanylate cyclase (GGDEF)-like protein